MMVIQQLLLILLKYNAVKMKLMNGSKFVIHTSFDQLWSVRLTSQLNKVFPGEDLKASYEVKKGNSYRFRIQALNMLGSGPSVTSEDILADDKFS